MSVASDMVTAIETALAINPIGVVEVTLPNGSKIKYNRTEAIKELKFWETRASDDLKSRLTGITYGGTA